ADPALPPGTPSRTPGGAGRPPPPGASEGSFTAPRVRWRTQLRAGRRHDANTKIAGISAPPRHRPTRGARPGTLLALQTLGVEHRLVATKLTRGREEATQAPTFRRLADELVTLLAYEAMREMRVRPVTVTTPLGPADGVKLAGPVPLVVPVLRAGIGMLDGMTRLLPTPDVGFVGMVRDEESLVASTYANRLPADLSGREVFVLDPMLATGGTLETVIDMLAERGAAAVTAVCLLAAPEGVAR